MQYWHILAMQTLLTYTVTYFCIHLMTTKLQVGFASLSKMFV